MATEKYAADQVRSREYEMDPGERTMELYLVDGGDLVCSCELTGWEDPSLWLSRLVTHPAYRRRRAALAILEAACMAALAAGKEAVSLNVRADNTGGCGAELRGGRCTDAICPSIRGCG